MTNEVMIMVGHYKEMSHSSYSGSVTGGHNNNRAINKNNLSETDKLLILI